MAPLNSAPPLRQCHTHHLLYVSRSACSRALMEVGSHKVCLRCLAHLISARSSRVTVLQPVEGVLHFKAEGYPVYRPHVPFSIARHSGASLSLSHLLSHRCGLLFEAVFGPLGVQWALGHGFELHRCTCHGFFPVSSSRPIVSLGVTSTI